MEKEGRGRVKGCVADYVGDFGVAVSQHGVTEMEMQGAQVFRFVA